MSYGVALRNGIPFTLGTIAALCVNATGQAWSPLALWPTGTEAGMWIDPSNLTSQWQDSTGTTPVSTPGTVADSSNPVGLALDLRLGATALTDPGNHLLQATSTARPLLSARVNLLTYTEDFSGWVVGNGSLSAATPPDGVTAATRYTWAGGGPHTRVFGGVVAATTARTYSILTRAGTGFTYLNIRFENSPSNVGICVNLLTGAITAGHYDGAVPLTAPSDSGAVDYGDGWWRIDITNGSFGTTFLYPSNNADSTNDAYTAGDYFDFTAIQLESGTTATPYQAVPGDGSTYTSTGFPVYQKYDGTDDGMATASFAAGTLTSGMDCMIAVRRDSAANAVCGLYESVSDANKVFGIAESGSGSGCVGSGAGTPTVWVDGVQLTGGTAVTRGTLHTALTVGDYHVLEFRGLDLSTWTGSGFGLYTGYILNGVQGGILLFPSSTSAADRDAARTWLGAKVGLTL